MATDPIDKIIRAIDEAIRPTKMSRDDALDFLERLQDELQMRMDPLREEIANDLGN